MAAESKDESSSTAAAAATAAPAKLPKGWVLGPDGKPCRTCSDLSSFTSMKNAALSTAAAPAAAPSFFPSLNDDCPPDSRALGRGSWTLLHSIAARYPERPTAGEQQDVRTFMRLFAKLYPCWYCADDFQTYLAASDVRVSSRQEFGQWLCRAHNAVNVKLGKPEFDCSRWEERWRDGWKDGRCG